MESACATNYHRPDTHRHMKTPKLIGQPRLTSASLPWAYPQVHGLLFCHAASVAVRLHRAAFVTTQTAYALRAPAAGNKGRCLTKLRSRALSHKHKGQNRLGCPLRLLFAVTSPTLALAPPRSPDYECAAPHILMAMLANMCARHCSKTPTAMRHNSADTLTAGSRAQHQIYMLSCMPMFARQRPQTS